MKLSLEIINNSKQSLGTAQIKLYWSSQTWRFDKTPPSKWNQVTQSRVGSFEVKDWGVVWLWDQPNQKGRNIAILWDAPNKASDVKKAGSAGRIFDPRNAALKQSEVHWSVAAPPVPQVPILAIRKKLVQWLKTKFKGEVVYGTKKYNEVTGGDKLFGGKSSKAGYTNCLALPGIMTLEIGKRKGLKGDELDRWGRPLSLSGTQAVRTKSMRKDAWKSAPLFPKGPIPGDIYALLAKGMTNHDTDNIGHVGVFLEIQPDGKWLTADFGQGSGYTGRLVSRDFKDGMLNSQGTRKPPRVLAGWVDIEKYFGLK